MADCGVLSTELPAGDSGNRGVLFLSYTGLMEPLGQSQVLAYQERLARDYEVHILSFERPRHLADTEAVSVMTARAESAGIHWHPLRYHKRFSVVATIWDILFGAWIGSRLVRRHGLAIVHARSYVPGVMALLIKRMTGARFLFDMRGFWVDERVDGGLWTKEGLLYRMGKKVERRLLLRADHVVSLTHAAVEAMKEFAFLRDRMPPMTVISTCTDLTRFVPCDGKKKFEGFTLGYVGSVGTWYMFNATVAAFVELITVRPDARLLIVNRDEHALILNKLREGGVDASRIELTQAEPEEIPSFIARMDAAAFFIKPVFSKQASAPTKLGEFLGCGIPVLTNAGVGDMAKILTDAKVGIAIDSFDDASIHQGVLDLLSLCNQVGVRGRCVQAAYRFFSLDDGVTAYQSVYASLSGREK